MKIEVAHGQKRTGVAAVTALGSMIAWQCFAGHTLKWEQVPEAVRTTVLANGGQVGPVDRESEKIDGKPVYEAAGKDKAGRTVDLVITEDGKLVTTKDDDAADKAKEDTAKAEKAIEALSGLKFSHPRDITNPWLPLGELKQDILESKKSRVERTAKPDIHKSFTFAGQIFDSLAVEDREFVDGHVEEVATDYFAQADDGTVCYLGEDVDEYKDGKVAGHEGAWLLDKETQIPGVIMPAHPKVGAKFKPEDVPGITWEEDQVISVSESVAVPAGTYKNCVKIKEKLSDGKTEYKYYASGVGCVKEVEPDEEFVLKSHAKK